MKFRQILYVVLQVVMALAAIGICLWSLLARHAIGPDIAAGIVLLALGQLAALGFSLTAAAKQQSASTGQAAGIAKLKNRSKDLHQRLEIAEDQIAQAITAGPAAPFAARQPVPPPPPPPPGGQFNHNQPDCAPPPAMPAAGQDLPVERLDLFLEPVVNLPSEETRLYRASLALQMNDGNHIEIASLASEVERDGMTSRLDLTVFKRAGPVIRRLQQRRRDVQVLCPVSSSTLADPGFLNDLGAYLRANEDIAPGLVVEVCQSSLAALSQAGMQGLAGLARMGATFCLARAQLQGPNPKTLSRLGFAYIEFDFDSLAASGWTVFAMEGPFATKTRKMSRAGINAIVSGITTRRDLGAVSGFAAMARGPLFSAPRQVRQESQETGRRDELAKAA